MFISNAIRDNSTHDCWSVLRRYNEHEFSFWLWSMGSPQIGSFDMRCPLRDAAIDRSVDVTRQNIVRLLICIASQEERVRNRWGPLPGGGCLPLRVIFLQRKFFLICIILLFLLLFLIREAFFVRCATKSYFTRARLINAEVKLKLKQDRYEAINGGTFVHHLVSSSGTTT